MTAIADAKTLFTRVSDEVSARTATEFARKYVRMSIVPEAGHAGVYTKTHMNRYLDELVSHLNEVGFKASNDRRSTQGAAADVAQRVPFDLW